MTNNVVIKVENLCKRYNLGALHSQTNSFRDRITSFFKKNAGPEKKETIWALKDVSFEVKKGEILGIIGRNGAGKSTLLKILSRITKPTSGKAFINGRVGSLLEVGTGFLPELTGRENIYLNSAILGMRKTEIDRKLEEIVDFAEIEKFIDTPVKRYSSGMYVRLAFAVAAHLEPDILLVDEVLAVGDLAFQKKCLGRMEAEKNEGRTVLFISHQMDAIRTLCQRTLWLDRGEVTKEGASHKIISAYEDININHQIEPKSNVPRTLENTQNPSFCFKRVQMLNSDGNHSTKFRYKDTLTLLVEFIGEPLSSHYSVEFRLFGEVGEVNKSINILCVGASGPFHNVYFNKKIKKIKINIGPLMLSSSNYSISLSVMTGRIRADTWDRACSFQVVDCHPVGPNHKIYRAGCTLKHNFSTMDE